MDIKYIFVTIAVIAAVTALLRFLPFIVFGEKRQVPRVISYLGKVLPYAAMGMLTVYCFKGVSFAKYPFGAPELIAGAAVALVHFLKRNTLLSIISGTVIYMILIQLVF